MEDFPLVEATLLVLTAPWWWPRVKQLCRTAWAEGREERPEPEPRDAPCAPQLFRDEGDAWSQRRIINAQWDTGRRAPRASGFRSER